MKAVAILCDYAAVAEGKLYISGGGWAIIGPAPSPSALAVKIDVPWDRTNSRIDMSIALFEQDGQPVLSQDPTAPQNQQVMIRATFEVGRPPGTTPGSTIDLPLAFLVPPLPLNPGARYVWRMIIDGEEHDDWTLPFQVRPAS